jgi:hypothetical protein
LKHEHNWRLAQYKPKVTGFGDPLGYYIGVWVCECGTSKQVQYHDD